MHMPQKWPGLYYWMICGQCRGVCTNMTSVDDDDDDDDNNDDDIHVTTE
jgi:hypothetical protein